MKKFWNIKNGDDAAELLLYGEISDASWYEDDVTPKQFAEDLKECGGKALTVRINSPGGDVFAAQAIYNQLKAYAGTVTVHIDGLCASAATLIACAGARVVMPDNALFMIHDPQAAVMDMMDAGKLEKLSRALEAVKKTIVNVYAKRSTKDAAGIAEAMAAETWMDAETAKAWGFVDEIDETHPVDSMVDNGMLIMNSVSVPCKGRLADYVKQKKGQPMKDSELITKVMDLLGVKKEAPAEDPAVKAERLRIADLDEAKKTCGAYGAAIIDAAKKTGAKLEDIAMYIEAVAAVPAPKNEALEAIRALFADSKESGADSVAAIPQIDDAEKDRLQQKADIDGIVNMANSLRGE